MYSIRRHLFFILIVKTAYALFAIFVFSRFTSLGDTQDYLDGEYIDRNNLASTAYLMSVIGSALGQWGGYIFSISLSSLGMCYLLRIAELPYRQMTVTMILIMLPSFGVWTSIFSKEVFVLFSFCLSTAGLIDLYNQKRRFFSLAQWCGLALLTFIKPHYAASIYISMLAIMAYHTGFKRELMLALMIIVLSMSCVLCFFYIDSIYYFTQIMPAHFSLAGGSTRLNTFWQDEWDFFTYLPIGATVAFIGPTFPEAISSPKLLPFFIEGCFLLGLILSYGWGSVVYQKKVNVLGLCLMMTFALTLMLTHYPFGLFNPGSAVRYRSGFIFPLCVFVLFLSVKNRPLKSG
ncbi:hypothetical protein GJV14_21915 [Enterobacteriaceae bacterium RIT697]|nr:hypothetical protein [Enterobacteriaceae bacterium RIT697]